MSLKDKNILIAGGSSGIGLALIKHLAIQGANIFNISRNTSTDWPEGVTHIQADILGDLSLIEDRLPQILHGLVYSVGSINLKPFQRLTKDDFLNDYQLNVVGAAELIRLNLKALKNAGSASIVLYSSVAAKAGMPFHASIAAAKGAVEGLTLSLAAELSASRIRVNAIAPSLTDTPLAKNLLSTDEKREASAKRHPLGKIGTPDDIALATQFLLSDHSAWLTGQIIGIDGGLGNLRPL
ncbi:SDR family NAD(P)-dependent oxidoreductase [Mucilaginibacter phyllosphaerae]|uniref:NAD(P)-dependent dehydrogenase (Short-subunit alcohol dehydrogenase family) n=1 Tax=Mucilaginibacter phyllosphaerae TaxID=1812349 RepID=A0A4Y8AK72_9SPHI|nr:SDR family oxidoreductase [Mucilaginibacter phyllosphaerae]MBB3967537.1 NAD(P)-dependent dehydrogenase (short-subunit alcohol dehydrogenase family) [Mucilaginibacter phyllosphaerae]TEW69403.1 SDR family oxidoreductase [Mucilaginibacter phyllosphaerae]GGH21286.1 oxidoreductase [Mucilaginibacter phyllosphaerae]